MRTGPDSGKKLAEISTVWEYVHDSSRFVGRYVPAMLSYLTALIKNRQDAEDVLQGFLLRVVNDGFMRVKRDGGRFRDYLRVALRNAALNHLQRKPKPTKPLFDVADTPADDEQWSASWRQGLLDRAWRELKQARSRSGENVAYQVLRATVDHPDDDSEALAALVSRRAGRSISGEAFRKQLSRARRSFAEILVREVTQTIDKPSRENVEAELSELGLMAYIRGYLPPDWRPHAGAS